MARKQDPTTDIPKGWEVVKQDPPVPPTPTPTGAKPPAQPGGQDLTIDIEGGRLPVKGEPEYDTFLQQGYTAGPNGELIAPMPEGFAPLPGNEIAPQQPGLADLVRGGPETVRGVAPAADWDGLQSGLNQLIKMRAPPEDIRKYLALSHSGGFEGGPPLAKGTEQWLGAYGQWLQKNPKGVWGGGNIKFQQVEAPPTTTANEARWAGVKSGALSGWDDEIGGFGGAVGNWLGRNAPWTAEVFGRGGDLLRGNFSDAFSANTNYEFDKGTGQGFAADMERERAGEDRFKNRAWRERPGQYMQGYIPGMITQMGVPVGRATQGGSAVGNTARLSGVGGFQAGFAGAGNSQPGERISGFMTNAPFGMILGPAAQPITRFGGAGLSKLGEVTGITPLLRSRGGNSLNSGLDALARRSSPEELEAIPGRVDDWRATGVEPRLVDAVGEPGRGTIRAAVPRAGPARTEAAEAANAVYADAPDRIAGQAQRILTPDVDPRTTSRRLANEVEGERNTLAGPEFDAARSQPVPLTPEVIDVLNTPEGQRALVAARGLMQPDERAQVNSVMGAVRQLSTIDPRLPPAAQQQIRAQIMQGVNFNVDVADKLSRTLIGRGRVGTNPGLGRISTDMGNTVRDAARTAVPEYDAALLNYEARSGVANAASREGQFQDADFLKAQPDVYADSIAGASRNPVDIGGRPISEHDALRVSAREQISDAARANVGGAPRVAREISSNSAQMDRSRALVGQRGAGQLRDAMGSEASRVANTRYIDERIGSKTAGMMDDAESGGIINLTGNALSGGKWSVVRGLGDLIRKAGMRGVDAERLVRDAISDDPRRVDEAVSYLVRKGMDQSYARTVVRSIIATGIGRTPSVVKQGPESDPVGSIVVQQ